MDWNKTKTIFIIVFLILDVFLLSQLVKKNTASQYLPKKDASIEEQLKEAGITYDALPQDKEKEKHYLLSVKTKKFSKEELDELDGQDAIIVNDTKISSTLDEPYKLGTDFDPEVLDSFVEDNIIGGEKYQFWRYNKESKKITYAQKFKDKVIFENVNGELTFYLNDKNEVVSYEQTMLDSIDEYNKEQIISSIQAVGTLFNKGMLRLDSKITNVELGYYTLVQTPESQVLTPTWHVVVNQGSKKDNLFVNAFEGSVITINKKLE
ncbi:two-component system regulatory protein YycI [Falsibacillus pallidus]|uniref:two-component system regulatory protein YycI n=1 Tax=Falsibacillus pallidus TaxID=493781 RepID=UPI003D98F7DA